MNAVACHYCSPVRSASTVVASPSCRIRAVSVERVVAAAHASGQQIPLVCVPIGVVRGHDLLNIVWQIFCEGCLLTLEAMSQSMTEGYLAVTLF